MPYDGSGNYVPPSAPTFPAISGTPISSTYYNSVINDISLALNNVVTRDGQGKPSAAINWNGQNLTGVNNLGAITAAFSGAVTMATTLAVTGNVTAGALTNTPLFWTRQSSLTIATGAITVNSTSRYFGVLTEGAAATDDLVTISGGTDGQIIILRGANSAQIITIKSSGNIEVPQDILLNFRDKLVALIYDSGESKWSPIALPYSAFTSAVAGLAPASGGGTTNFLRADGTWAAPATVSLFPLTMNNSGTGVASGTTFDGSVARTLSYNTLGAVPTGAITTSGLTQATNRLLGRTTGGTGAIEELTAGATLSLSGGSLGVASVPSAATFNNSGSGVASGTTYNGSTARTISYNTIGAQPAVPNVQSTASTATLTPDGDDNDICVITAQAASLTIAAPSGSPTQGRGMVIRIKDNGTSRTITWNAIYRAIGITLPTATVVSKIVYVGIIYNSTDNKWDAVSLAQEA